MSNGSPQENQNPRLKVRIRYSSILFGLIIFSEYAPKLYIRLAIPIITKYPIP